MTTTVTSTSTWPTTSSMTTAKFRAYYAAAGYPGPLSYGGQADALYRNDGDGTFTEVTREAGMIHNPNGRAMSAVAADLNNDGLPGHPTSPTTRWRTYYYENTGKGSVRQEKGAD